MKTYNIIFNGTKLNTKPLSLKQAEIFQSECIYNYGYKPRIYETTK